MLMWKFRVEGYFPDGEDFKHHGVTYGETMTEAVEHVEESYGEDMCSLFIECIPDSGSVYIFEDDNNGSN